MEYTLKSGKIVVLRELTAYHEYLMARFIVGPMVKDGEFTSSYLLQAEQLDVIFSLQSVDGKDVETPTDEKSLILAFASLKGHELEELMGISRKKRMEGNGNTASGSTSAPNS